jgi:hypothetical protein
MKAHYSSGPPLASQYRAGPATWVSGPLERTREGGIPWSLGSGGVDQSGEPMARTGRWRWLEQDRPLGEPFDVSGEEEAHHISGSTMACGRSGGAPVRCRSVGRGGQVGIRGGAPSRCDAGSGVDRVGLWPRVASASGVLSGGSSRWRQAHGGR